jgi:hypothetical protein
MKIKGSETNEKEEIDFGEGYLQYEKLRNLTSSISKMWLNIS